MAILDAVLWLQSQLSQIEGIKAAPNYPDGVELPAIITHLTTGEISGGGLGMAIDLDNISCTVHISDANMPEAFQALETLHPLIRAVLLSDKTLGGTIQTCGTITYATGRAEWGGFTTWARTYTLNNCKSIT